MIEPPRLPETLVKRLRQVRACGVITGAGVSRDSGIRTYRGKGGLYDDPRLGQRMLDALTAETLEQDPDRTWDAIAEICRQARFAEPNAAHHALAAIERKVERFTLLTQNVDGLHQRAGSRSVIEIHGNVFHTSCTRCDFRGRLTGQSLHRIKRAPRCQQCNGVLRPDVVLFGELLALNRVETLLEEFYLRAPELVIVAGTSALFSYITEPVLYAQQAGRLTVEINPEPTALTDQVSIALRGRAETYLPAIARAMGIPAPLTARHASEGQRRELDVS